MKTTCSHSVWPDVSQVQIFTGSSLPRTNIGLGRVNVHVRSICPPIVLPYYLGGLSESSGIGCGGGGLDELGEEVLILFNLSSSSRFSLDR